MPETEPFEIKGKWWTPDAPGAGRKNGILKYHPQTGITLDLYFEASLIDAYGLMKAGHKTWHGISSSGDYVSLLHCFYRHVKPSPTGQVEAQVIVNYLFIGDRVTSLSDTFYSATISISNLNEWFDKKALNIEHSDDFTKITIDRQNRVDFYEIPEKSFSVALRKFTPFSFAFDDEFEIQTKADIVIYAYTGKEIIWFKEIIHSIQILFSLLYGDRASILKTKYTSNNLSIYDSHTNYQYIFEHTQDQRPETVSVKQHDLLTTNRDIASEMPNLFNRWFSMTEDMKDVLNLFMSINMQRNLYPHVLFLTMMQAFEAYHRSIGAGSYVSNTEYETIRQTLTSAIPSSTPNDLKASLRSRIKFGNEHSLRKRLKSTIDGLDDALVSIFTSDRKAFINTSVDTRNFYTHWDRSSSTGTIDTNQLVSLNAKLKKFLTIILLSELNISQSTIKRCVANARTLREPKNSLGF